MRCKVEALAVSILLTSYNLKYFSDIPLKAVISVSRSPGTNIDAIFHALYLLLSKKAQKLWRRTLCIPNLSFHCMFICLFEIVFFRKRILSLTELNFYLKTSNKNFMFVMCITWSWKHAANSWLEGKNSQTLLKFTQLQSLFCTCSFDTVFIFKYCLIKHL